ncbi:MAG: restriction endonuclease subunit S [Thiomicrorhabdus sp.]|nr:restriction endonuclease subunit S [Thiomicrorhabdus sp.]
MSVENNIPAIRFKGFSGEWEDRKIKDIIANLSGGASIKPDDYQEKGKRTIPKGAVNSSGIADLSGSKYISLEFYGKNILSKVSSGDLVTSLRDLVPTAPSMGRVVKIKEPKEDFLMPQGVYKIALLKNADENFLISYSNSRLFRKIISREKNGSTQVHIRNGDFLDIEITKPKLQEQTKIGNYFQQLDTLIFQHQQKHDKLLNLKKSLLEKIFPKQGKNEPEIRFKGFSGAWENKNIFMLGEVVTGSTPSTQNQTYYSNDGIPWVTPTDISQNVTFQTAKYLSEFGGKVARLVPENTILVTCIASIGKNTLLGTLGSFNQQINGLIPHKSENNPYFLFTLSFLWSNQMKRTAASGTMQIVNKKEFSELKTTVPKHEEQTKIGKLFKTLDTLLSQHQSQLKKLKQIKQACLAKMFV